MINKLLQLIIVLVRPKMPEFDSPHFLYQVIGILRLIFAYRRSDGTREDIGRLASHSERR